jgi:deoxyribodipyrimidine photo-lyase
VSPAIVLFQFDLRLADNPALTEAARSGRPLVLLYVYESKNIGRAQRWWLSKALPPEVVVRKGPLVKTVLAVARETDAEAVYWNRTYQGEQPLFKGLEMYSFNGSLLVEPWEVKPYKVFTPFWKRCLELIDPQEPLPTPKWKRGPKIASDPLPGGKSPAGEWEPGEKGAHKQLKAFIRDHLGDYDRLRDRPDLPATSRLSPHLHFGEISPRQVWHAVREASRGAGAKAFLTEIGWREFSYHLLYHNPKMGAENLNPKFDRMKWRTDPKALKAWQEGKTGYPLVDAGMRELLATGWMHNRARMITASFLVKDLLIDWREGAKWFWDHLLDADPANNAASWQWVAGSGADAAPFFRIFNPILQAGKFDPNGTYIEKWAADLDIAPIVNHSQARERALAAYKRLS